MRRRRHLLPSHGPDLRDHRVAGKEAHPPAGPPEDLQVEPNRVSVPGFTAEVLHARLVEVSDQGPEHLLFITRDHTPLTTNNVRRRLRAALAGTEITGVTSHSFRRTVATFVDRAGGPELAAELLGHTSSDITKAHYIEPNEQVNPLTAEILEVLAPKSRHG